MINKRRWGLICLMSGMILTASITAADFTSTTADTSKPPPKPKVYGGSKYFLDGESFSLNCTVKYEINKPVALSWTLPPKLNKDTVTNFTNDQSTIGNGEVLFYNITIRNATYEADGLYTCMSKNMNGTETDNFYKTHLDEAMLDLSLSGEDAVPTKSRLIKIPFALKDYPAANYTFLRDDEPLLPNKIKYNITRRCSEDPCHADVVLTIRQLGLADFGNYTMVATNGYKTESVTYHLIVGADPKVKFSSITDRYLLSQIVTLECEATGYPLPEVTWSFEPDKVNATVRAEQSSVNTLQYKVLSRYTITARYSGNVTCTAEDPKGKFDIAVKRFIVYELHEGFGIKDMKDTWFSENDDVLITCVASRYDYENVTWVQNGEALPDYVSYSSNDLSHIAILNIEGITVEQAGTYTCITLGGSTRSPKEDSILLSVTATRPPFIKKPMDDTTLDMFPYQRVVLACEADAVPPPTIEWFKDGVPVINTSNIQIVTNYMDKTVVNSTIELQLMEDNKGKYDCIVTSGSNKQTKSYVLNTKEKSPFKATYLAVVIAIVFVLLIVVAYLSWKIRKEKQFKKELAAAGLLHFEKGLTRSLNPELGINEQAELLPYDERFEFPVEKLILGKQLGAGAFGVVYQAEARGLINAEETTTVAVKMVKKTADNMYIKALASELKIMIHLGKHAHIVNLLGACTKNVAKRELYVIVEYCKFGNIHNYLQKHREVFIDQLTDNKEKNMGRVNNAFSYSTGSSGIHTDYFGSNHTQNTDNTILNTGNTSRSGRKVSDTGYVLPQWRSNYDYCYDGRTPRPLCSRDLIAWAFQIAMGMEYLSSRKVLHSDLAARNVLLTEGNVVKICDFGLARSIYKNDEYKKKEDSPLPVKWLAIECMTDRIFSTQSDVWSYGIVLWELFSLAKTPYPNMSPHNLLQFLTDGHRLEKPPYSDDRLYRLMKQCWEKQPTLRPSFAELRQTIGGFLDDRDRAYYEDLNEEYMEMNRKRDGQQDYLEMVCAPDYNNLVTPSPHHYANDGQNFFPSPQLPQDEEGYLQMSPANQASLNKGTNAFDFDKRRCNARSSEASSCAPELTPMLPLSNLEPRVSDSDHEGNNCPPIDEENEV